MQPIRAGPALPALPLLSALGRGAAAAGREVKMVGELGLPEDFPVPPAFGEGCYLKIKRLWVA